MVSRTLVQTLGGIELARKRKVGDLDLGFAGGRLLVKSLAPGCLCILTVKRVNIPLVNMTANVAVKKLKELRKEIAPAAEPARVAAVAVAPAPAVPTAPPRRRERMGECWPRSNTSCRGCWEARPNLSCITRSRRWA